MGPFRERLALGVAVVVAAIGVAGPRLGSAQAQPRDSIPPSVSPRASASKLVKAGIAAMEAKDYGKAIALYLKAFSLDPHPLLLFNVAQAHRLAGCTGRAAPFYERYLALDPQGSESAVAREILEKIRAARKPDGSDCARVSAVDELAASSPPTPSPTGRLKLHSAPEGVVVMLDGVKIGSTPLEHEVSAGAHTIVLVDGDTLVGEQKAEINPGKDLELTILVRYPSGRSRRQGRSRLAPVLLWVGGGLALAGSGVAFYLSEKGGPDNPGDPYIYEGATPIGLALAGTGVAAVGAGVWLWGRGSRESAPAVSIGPGGASFGWSGRF